MTISIAAAARQAEANAIGDALNSGKIRIYDGARPDADAAVTTQNLLAELTFAADAFPAATDDGTIAQIAANAITSDPSADATGTASWFRVVNSAGTTQYIDGDCGLSGSDLNMNTLSIVAGGQVDITSFIYKRPQA